MVSRPSYVASTDCMLRSTLLSICFSHKSDNRTMAHCHWDVFSHAPMAAPYVTTLPVPWLATDWRYVPLWKGLLNAWFFGTSKIHWFVTGFEFTISIAIILIPHVHAPVFYIVANPKLSCFPVCSSAESLELPPLIPWSFTKGYIGTLEVAPSSQSRQEVGKIYFYQVV